MSRIQDLMNKAEREGGMRRTRGLTAESADGGPPPVVAPWVQTAAEPLRPAISPRARTPEPVAPPFKAAESTGLDPLLVAALAHQSLAAEQFRSLRTRIAAAENGKALRTILVTSPAKGDGKSLTASNLALTMAQEFHRRVLLIDADLRRPQVHRMFGLRDGAPGLSDVLAGAADVESSIVSLAEHRLSVLPGGVATAHPAELLGSAAMRRLVDGVRTRFDRVILDTPPLAPLADVQILSPLADGVLIIVRAGFTPKPAIERALSVIDRSRVIGLVLNEAGRTDANAHDYDGYRYLAG
jgi:capsular exopolysaccharide synthesis family protein